MSKSVSDNNYFSVQAWMVTKLQLKGAERDVYAIVYGYSQDGESNYHGSLQYIAELTGYSRNSICTALNSLTNKGLLIKEENEINNIKYCKYRTSDVDGVQTTCTGVQTTCTNNISNTKKIDNNTISKDIVENFEFGKKKEVITKQKKPSLYDKCVSMINDFTNNGKERELLIKALNLFLENSRESGTPFYSNHFKGKLNTLQKLSSHIDIKCEIIQQTLDNGWNNFYEIKEKKKRNVRRDIEKLPDVEEVTKEEKESYRRSMKDGQKF